jgi:hypothetical protein
VNLWAGQAYPLMPAGPAAIPAADLVCDLWDEAQAALSQTADRYGRPAR